MWPFSKHRSLADSGVFKGFTDWHSHILPGVDDGVQTTEESLEILRCYEQLGIKTVWLTPHIMEDVPNATEGLKERFEELKKAYKGEISLHLAAENMLDNLFAERLEQNDLLPLGKNKECLLVETSCFNPPMELHGMLKRIKIKGYHPVLAHPERYLYMMEKEYYILKETGVKFQLNLPSLAGTYGKEVQRRARKLMEKGMYDVCGTDTHTLHSFSNTAFSHSYNSSYSCLASKQGQALCTDVPSW